MSFKYKAPFNEVLGCTLSLTRHIFTSQNMSQSEFSEDIGFNRRLLSKYELGTSNISFATYIYIFQRLGVDGPIAEKILKKVIMELVNEGVYVYLNADNISLANSADETMKKYSDSNSYHFSYDWFGLKYFFDFQEIKDKFDILENIEYKTLDEKIEGIFRRNSFARDRDEYLFLLKQEKIEDLERELKDLKIEYVDLFLDENYQLKDLDSENISDKNKLLDKIKDIEASLSKLNPDSERRRWPPGRFISHNGMSLNNKSRRF